MPMWLGMMFAPRQKWVQDGSRSPILFIISAGHYLLAILNAIRKDNENQGETNLDLRSLEGVRKGLSTPQGALAGWTHMIALDLFTGAWIYRQCLKLKAPDWVRITTLGFTLMTGPFGLMLFLLWRWFGAEEQAPFE